MADTKRKRTQSVKSDEKPKESLINAKQFARSVKLGVEIGGVIENWIMTRKGEAFPKAVTKTIGEWQKVWIEMNKEKA